MSVAARDGAALDQLATEFRGHAFVADLLDPVQVDGLIDRVEAAVGPVDVLVNNAGMETIGAFHATDPSVIRDVAQLNFEVPMVLTRQVLPGMLQRRRGHVVFLSSLAGTSGFAGMAVYSGTKAGLNNFVASIRMELKDTPITTTVVAPGPVDTEMWDRVEAATEYAACSAGCDCSACSRRPRRIRSPASPSTRRSPARGTCGCRVDCSSIICCARPRPGSPRA